MPTNDQRSQVPWSIQAPPSSELSRATGGPGAFTGLLFLAAVLFAVVYGSVQHGIAWPLW